MEIKVIYDKDQPTYITGGSFEEYLVVIHLDPIMPLDLQRENIIHGVIEAFCPSWIHSSIDRLTELIQDALLQWDEVRRE